MASRFGVVVTGITAIQGVIAPILYLMLLDKGIDIVQLGILLAVLTFFGMALEIPFGTLADNYGRKRVFLLGESILLFATAGYWLADSFEQLIAVAILNGTGTALISGTLDALFVEKQLEESADNDSAENSQKAQAMYGSFQAIGLALGGVLAGFLPIWFRNYTDQTDLVGYYEVNVILLIPLVALHLAATAFLIPESNLPRSGTIKKSFSEVRGLAVDSFRRLARSRVLTVLLIGQFLGGVAGVSIEQLWQPQFDQIVDAKSTTWAFGLVFTVNFVFLAIGQGISIPLARLFGNDYSRMLLVVEVVLGAVFLLFLSSTVDSRVYYLLLAIFAYCRHRNVTLYGDVSRPCSRGSSFDDALDQVYVLARRSYDRRGCRRNARSALRYSNRLEVLRNPDYVICRFVFTAFGKNICDWFCSEVD